MGFLLGGAALIRALIGTLVITSGHDRDRGLKWIVGTRFVAIVVLIASTID